MSVLLEDENDSIELVKSKSPSSSSWHSIPSYNAHELELELYLNISRLNYHIVESIYHILHLHQHHLMYHYIMHIEVNYL